MIKNAELVNEKSYYHDYIIEIKCRQYSTSMNTNWIEQILNRNFEQKLDKTLFQLIPDNKYLI